MEQKVLTICFFFSYTDDSIPHSLLDIDVCEKSVRNICPEYITDTITQTFADTLAQTLADTITQTLVDTITQTHWENPLFKKFLCRSLKKTNIKTMEHKNLTIWKMFICTYIPKYSWSIPLFKPIGQTNE